MDFIITFCLAQLIYVVIYLLIVHGLLKYIAISSKIHEKLLAMMYCSFVHHVRMHRLPMALNCYNKANEVHSTIDSKFAAMELSTFQTIWFS